jgi:hypothetical protein
MFNRRVNVLGSTKLLTNQTNFNGIDVQTMRVSSGSRLVFYLDITQIVGSLIFSITNAATEEQTFLEIHESTYTAITQVRIPVTELQRLVTISITCTNATYSLSVSAADNSTSEEAEDLLQQIVNNQNGQNVTVINGPGSSAVNIQDGGNSITVDAIDLDIRDLVFATDKVDVSGSTIALDATTLAALEDINVTVTSIGEVEIKNDAGNPVPIDDAGGSLTVDAIDLDIRNLTFFDDKVDASGTTLGSNSGVDIGDVTINNGSGAGAVNIQDGGNSITVDVDGVYDIINNADPDNVGLIAHSRNASPADAHQTERLTSVTSGTVKALDVSLHDENGVPYSSSNNLNVINPSIGTNDAIAVSESTLIAGRYESGTMIPVLVDEEGRIITSAITGFGADFSFGDFLTTTTGQFSVRRTTYTEQTTNAQRSILSTSASDTSAGTGARTVVITYYDSTGTGPFTETITLNGITAVNTTNTNICFIEKIQVSTIGSNNSNVGIISLKAATGGGGITIGTIGVGHNQTFWAHHYVPIGKICNITGVSVGNDSTVVGNGALFVLKSIPIGISNAVESQISDFITLYGQSSSIYRNYASPIKVAGPARIAAYVSPNNTVDQTQRLAFDFFQP